MSSSVLKPLNTQSRDNQRNVVSDSSANNNTTNRASNMNTTTFALPSASQIRTPSNLSSQNSSSRSPLNFMPSTINNPSTSMNSDQPSAITIPGFPGITNPGPTGPTNSSSLPPDMKPNPSTVSSLQNNSSTAMNSNGFRPTPFNSMIPPNTSSSPFVTSGNQNPNGISNQQNAPTSLVPSTRSQPINNDDSLSRLELDYPIENVLIDANIPSSIAIKINDVVDKDRLGNIHHTHRYTFEPASQQTSFSNLQQTTSSFNQSIRPIGIRHIREINSDRSNLSMNDIDYNQQRQQQSIYPPYPSYSPIHVESSIEQYRRSPGHFIIEPDNINSLEYSLRTQPVHVHTEHELSPLGLLPFPEPILYYSAFALPDDPMKLH
jgi:hypothetical protein